MKRCGKCGVDKPREEWARNKAKSDGLSSQCKSCKADYDRQRKEADVAATAVRNTRSRLWYSENLERAKAAAKLYRETHKENSTLRDRRRYERIQLTDRPRRHSYYQQNKAAHRARAVIRDARTRLATPPWLHPSALTPLYEEARRKYQDTGLRYEVDHVVPVHHQLVCGLNVPWNLQVITAKQNREKSNKFDPMTT